MSHAVVIAVAGVPVRVESAFPAVTRLTAARFPETAAAPVARLRVDVLAGSATTAARAPRWSFRGPDVIVIDTPDMSAELDIEQGSGVARVRTDALDGVAFPRPLEGALYSLINRKDRHPVHAAAIRLGDAALVLHGPSGVGKSTLAYAAYRAGIDVLADDASRIQLVPELRVWGDGTPARVQLLESLRETFPELRDAPVGDTDGGGSAKVVVSTKASATWTPFGLRPHVCLLARTAGYTRDVRMRAASADEIHAVLMSAPEARLDLAPANRARVLRALSASGGWHLHLSPNAEDAVPRLRQMLEAINGQE